MTVESAGCRYGAAFGGDITVSSCKGHGVCKFCVDNDWVWCLMIGCFDEWLNGLWDEDEKTFLPPW